MFPKSIKVLWHFLCLQKCHSHDYFLLQFTLSHLDHTPNVGMLCNFLQTYFSLAPFLFLRLQQRWKKNNLILLAINNYQIFFYFVPLLHSIDQRPSAARFYNAIAHSTSARYAFCHFSIHFWRFDISYTFSHWTKKNFRVAPSGKEPASSLPYFYKFSTQTHTVKPRQALKSPATTAAQLSHKTAAQTRHPLGRFPI